MRRIVSVVVTAVALGACSSAGGSAGPADTAPSTSGQLVAAEVAVEEQMSAINAAWRSSPRDGVEAEAAAAWPEGAWTWEEFACPPGELTADTWLQQLADQGYSRAQHLDSLEPDVGWTPPDDGSPGGGETPVGDVYLVHGTFVNGGREAKGEAHWVVDGATAHWLASRCISP